MTCLEEWLSFILTPRTRQWAVSDFTDLSAKVVGVSTQSVDSHRSFADYHALKFTLVADEEKLVSCRYGTIGILGLNRRVTHLIDPEGIITGVYRSEARPRSHAERARRELASQGASESIPS